MHYRVVNYGGKGLSLNLILHLAPTCPILRSVSHYAEIFILSKCEKIPKTRHLRR